MMKKGSTLRDAARANGMSQERLRRYLKENTQTSRVGRCWHIIDRRDRQFPIYSNGALVNVVLDVAEASRAGKYMHAVKVFLDIGDPKILAPYRGHGVWDVKRKFHPFETDENTLYELDVRGELAFPELYRIAS